MGCVDMIFKLIYKSYKMNKIDYFMCIFLYCIWFLKSYEFFFRCIFYKLVDFGDGVI